MGSTCSTQFDEYETQPLDRLLIQVRSEPMFLLIIQSSPIAITFNIIIGHWKMMRDNIPKFNESLQFCVEPFDYVAGDLKYTS